MSNDQQPAFPTWKRSEDVLEGMSLRDYFANNAMLGLVAANADLPEHPTTIARLSYELADAMMEERSS